MLRMFCRSPMNATPMTVPHIVPEPPNSAAPPMITAEITVSSRPVPVTPCTYDRNERPRTPAAEAQKPDRTNAVSLTFLVSIPTSRAASALPPTA